MTDKDTPQPKSFPSHIPYTTHTVTHGADNLTLSYISAGPEDGPLLVFLHGWPAIALTWHPQLSTFASLGFHVLAPDMPGYGDSSSRHEAAHYSVESVVTALLALLKASGHSKAVWIGHDWGCGGLWGLASHHPEVCRAIAGLTVPFWTLELGLQEGLLPLVNRDIYPEDRYPYGQWSYQAFYEQNFESATAFMDKDPGGFLRALYRKGDPDSFNKPAATSDVVRDGGWMQGIEKPPSADQIPDSTVVKGLDKETHAALTAAMTKTKFWAADAYYLNHERNNKYTKEKSVNGGHLDMPVLFIEAKYDSVASTANSDLANPMRERVKNLTYVTIESGHWVGEEKPEEVNAALVSWLLHSVSDWWPGSADSKWLALQ